MTKQRIYLQMAPTAHSILKSQRKGKKAKVSCYSQILT